jgi:hypothetical protein
VDVRGKKGRNKKKQWILIFCILRQTVSGWLKQERRYKRLMYYAWVKWENRIQFWLYVYNAISYAASQVYLLNHNLTHAPMYVLMQPVKLWSWIEDYCYIHIKVVK